jgi:hypothetical protein
MRLPRIALLAALAPLGGCMTGLIYTHTVVPLTTNFRAGTPVFTGKLNEGESDVKDLRIPWPVSMDVRWHSNAIGDIAKREGIEEIYYADIEHLSVLFSIWRQDTVHVYGKAAPGAAQLPADPPTN